MIKSISYDQREIIANILQLCDLENFHADLTYGNGGFYKNLPKPTYYFDIDHQSDDVVKANSTDIPLPDCSLKSIMFDPPFLTYVKSCREHGSIMSGRFGGYWTYQELTDHYVETIIESHRLLEKKGILVIKCQDIVHNHKLHPTHINIVNWAEGLFRLKDMFILAAKHRMAIPPTEGHAKKVQRHARIHHSYFMVFEKC